MKKNEVKVGRTYQAKVSDRIVPVRIDSVHSKQGWNATNTRTGKRIHIKSAQRLRRAVAEHPARRGPAAGTTPGEQGLAAAKAEARERAMAASAKKTKVTKADAKEAVAAVVANDAKAAEVARTVDAVKGGNLAAGIAIPTPQKSAAKSGGSAKPKRTSAIDAAAQVLKKAGKPMNCKTLIAAMAEQGLWTSPNGKTPHATLYAAILREIGNKGPGARFAKADRGQFTFNAEAR